MRDVMCPQCQGVGGSGATDSHGQWVRTTCQLCRGTGSVPASLHSVHRVAQAIRPVRIAAIMSGREAAALVGMNMVDYSHLENGRDLARFTERDVWRIIKAIAELRELQLDRNPATPANGARIGQEGREWALWRVGAVWADEGSG